MSKLIKIAPKNWGSFQHYKNRKPPWIKLHRGLLDDYDFHCLPVASKALAPCLWLLASEYEKGEIVASPEQLAFRLHMSINELVSSLIPLINSGFFSGDSAMLAKCVLHDCGVLVQSQSERESPIHDDDIDF
jgi:hypothetical protein